MRTILVCIAIILLSSCGSKKATVVAQDRVVKDSVVITTKIETVYDTIQIKGDSVSIKAAVQDLTSTPVSTTSATGRSRITLSRKRDTIIADCNIDDLQEVIEVQNKTIEELRMNTETNTITQQIDVPFVPWYWRYGLYGSLGLNLLLLLVVIFFYLKSLLKFPI